MSANSENRPVINVTPLIDILLVLLIIFMAISPIKPSSFKAKIPSEPKNQNAGIDPLTLVVTINPDSTLLLNGKIDAGTISEPQKLIETLSGIFQKRLENRVYAEGTEMKNDLPEIEKIQKTVFIKAPRSMPYIEVAKVVDSVKQAGASPIALQIDDLR